MSSQVSRIVLFSLVLAISPSLASLPRIAAAQAPPTLVPNDPGYRPSVGDLLNFTQALYAINQKEHDGRVNPQDPVVIVADTGIDYTHPDLSDNCLPQYNLDLVSPPVAIPDILNPHGTLMAGIIAASANNGIASASINLYPRVKVISVRVGYETPQVFITPSVIRQLMTYALTLKAQGVNVVAINLSFVSPADDNPETSRQLLRDLHQAGIWMFAAAEQQSGGGINWDQATGLLPGSYAREPGMPVILVTGILSDGTVHPNFGWGPGTVALAAPSEGTGPAPGNSTAGANGTSCSTAEATQAFCEELLYGPETDPDRAVAQMIATSYNKGLGGKVLPTGGAIDMYALLGTSLVPPPPLIAGATVAGAKLIINGSGFGGNPSVLINGLDKSDRIRTATDGRIMLKKQLGFNTGNNTIKVITAERTGSATYTLAL